MPKKRIIKVKALHKPQELDPHWRTRVPSNAFRIVRTNRKPARYMKLDVDPLGNGTIQCASLDFGQPRVLDYMILWGTGDFELVDLFGGRIRPISYEIETYRKRASDSTKIKILNLIPGPKEVLTTNPGVIFSTFNSVLAVDTNTPHDMINNETISVCGLATTRKMAIGDRFMEIKNNRAIEFRNLQEPREKHAWKVAIESAIRAGIIKTGEKSAVIVDAYQNELKEFNSGREIVPGFKLPESIKLIYAASDTGGTYYSPNRCIKLADDFARTIIRGIFQRKIPEEPFKVVTDQPYTKIRYHYLENKNGRSIITVNT